MPIKRGGLAVIALFLGTIVSTALLHQLLHLSPFLGMMTAWPCFNSTRFSSGRFFIRRAELRGFSPPVDLDSEAFNLRDH
jgi:hypothetical protein